MFHLQSTSSRYPKSRTIADNASTVTLSLDTDDVNPDDVTDDKIGRIVAALNLEFYGTRQP